MRKPLNVSSSESKAVAIELPLSAIRYFPLGRLFDLKLFVISALVSVMLLLAFYAYQISCVVSENYQVQSYQKKINSLSQENKLLQISAIKVNSLENVESRIQELGLEKTEKIYYIQALENPVVTKK